MTSTTSRAASSCGCLRSIRAFWPRGGDLQCVLTRTYRRRTGLVIVTPGNHAATDRRALDDDPLRSLSAPRILNAIPSDRHPFSPTASAASPRGCVRGRRRARCSDRPGRLDRPPTRR
jgi:hypothetical protein